MEPKDTVTPSCALCSSATNQAEISFKAGMEEQAKRDYNTIDNATKNGIREVVEWFGGYDKAFPTQREYKAKLREWGL